MSCFALPTPSSIPSHIPTRSDLVCNLRAMVKVLAMNFPKNKRVPGSAPGTPTWSWCVLGLCEVDVLDALRAGKDSTSVSRRPRMLPGCKFSKISNISLR